MAITIYVIKYSINESINLQLYQLINFTMKLYYENRKSLLFVYLINSLLKINSVE